MKEILDAIKVNSSLQSRISLAVSLFGFIINAVAFYPGILSPDSLDQYNQALGNAYGDWHPPVMAGLWHLLLYVYNGPQPMLFFQLVLLWTSFFLLFGAFLKHYTHWSFLIILLFFAPFVQNFAGNIWKDMHMSFSWLLATAIMVRASLNGRRLSFIEATVCLLFLSYGCWVRPSGFPGLMPLLFLWWNLVVSKPFLKKTTVSIVAVLVLLLAVLLMQNFLSTKVLKADRNHIEYKLIAHDLTGLSVKSGELCFPDYISNTAGFDTAYLFKNYTCVTFDNIWWNNDNKHIMPHISEAQIVDLQHYWIKTIVKHPVIYLKNKVNGFLFFLRLRNSGSAMNLIYSQTHPNKFGFTYTRNVISDIIFKPIKLQTNAPYMRPWFWFFLNIVLIVVILRKKNVAQKMMVLSLALSAFFYLSFHFFIYPIDTEFRYSYWSCLCVSICFLIMVAQHFKARHTASEGEIIKHP